MTASLEKLCIFKLLQTGFFSQNSIGQKDADSPISCNEVSDEMLTKVQMLQKDFQRCMDSQSGLLQVIEKEPDLANFLVQRYSDRFFSYLRDHSEECLIAAARSGNEYLVRFLIKTFAIDVNVIRAGIVLHMAVASGNIGLVRYLIEECRANVNVVVNGNTPLDMAIAGENFLLFRMLIENWNADERYVDAAGLTFLHKAVYGGKFEIVQYLVETRKLNLKAVTREQNSVLHIAALCGDYRIVRYLAAQCPALLKMVDNKGANVLHYAAFGGKKTVFCDLIDTYGLDINAVDGRGANVLHYAAWGGDKDFVEYLVEVCNFSIDAADRRGASVVEYGFNSKKLPVFLYLTHTLPENIPTIHVRNYNVSQIVCLSCFALGLISAIGAYCLLHY